MYMDKYNEAPPVVLGVSKNDQMFFIEGSIGRLQTVLSEPKRQNGIDAVVVVCHPHPLYDGSLNNKVTYTLARTLSDLGIPAIRFNFRGVGESDGTFANGVGETDDLISVIRFAQRRYPTAQLWLAGFSFGAYVALRASEFVAVDRLITVAPSVNFFNFNQVSTPSCPWLVVQGDSDEVVACADVLKWLQKVKPKPQIVVLPQVGHFFHKRLGDLRRAVEDFVIDDMPHLLAAQDGQVA
jgi:alpha/beta superfamily hydrolase